jgi:hypothetical protein
MRVFFATTVVVALSLEVAGYQTKSNTQVSGQSTAIVADQSMVGSVDLVHAAIRDELERFFGVFDEGPLLEVDLQKSYRLRFQTDSFIGRLDLILAPTSTVVARNAECRSGSV